MDTLQYPQFLFERCLIPELNGNPLAAVCEKDCDIESGGALGKRPVYVGKENSSLCESEATIRPRAAASLRRRDPRFHHDMIGAGDDVVANLAVDRLSSPWPVRYQDMTTRVSHRGEGGLITPGSPRINHSRISAGASVVGPVDGNHPRDCPKIPVGNPL
jgi:hypothetical protein